MTEDHDKPPNPNPPHPYPGRRSPKKIVIALFAMIILLAALTVLVLYLVYNPKKPTFTVIDAALYSLNLTSPPFLSATLQFTLVTTNPNPRVSLLYDRLSATVYYLDEAITVPVQLPDLFQERRGTVAMALVVGGGEVPVSEEVAAGVAGECRGYGVVEMRLVVMGRVGYEFVGGFRSGRYGVYVRCDVLVGFKTGLKDGDQVSNLIGGETKCKVDI